MQKNVPLEFIYQVFSLIIAVIIIHAIYVSIIRPGAREVLEQQAIEINSNPNYVPERSTYVVIRDFEQEACFVLMVWAFSLMGYKAWRTREERLMMSRDLVPMGDGISILPEDTRESS